MCSFASNNNHASVFPYYASIMLHAFGYLLCYKLCRHNRPGPIYGGREGSGRRAEAQADAANPKADAAKQKAEAANAKADSTVYVTIH